MYILRLDYTKYLKLTTLIQHELEGFYILQGYF